MDRSSYQVRINQWLSILKDQASSHMTKSAWCRENGIPVRQFYYWQKRLRNFVLESSDTRSSELIPVRQDVPTFCELSAPQKTGNIVPHENSVTSTSDLIIEVRDCRIFISSSVSKKTLSSVMEVIRNV